MLQLVPRDEEQTADGAGWGAETKEQGRGPWDQRAWGSPWRLQLDSLPSLGLHGSRVTTARPQGAVGAGGPPPPLTQLPTSTAHPLPVARLAPNKSALHPAHLHSHPLSVIYFFLPGFGEVVRQSRKREEDTLKSQDFYHGFSSPQGARTQLGWDIAAGSALASFREDLGDCEIFLAGHKGSPKSHHVGNSPLQHFITGRRVERLEE